MDKAWARKLIQPLSEGAPLTAGWSLSAVELHQSDTDQRKDSIHLVLSSELRLVISPRSEQPAAFRTPSLNVTIKGPSDLTPTQRHAINVIRQRLQANDRPPPTTPPDLTPEATDVGAHLWLIPGHIGSPLDLTVRALRVLGRTERLFAEPGTRRGLTSLFEQHGLGELPEVVELSIDDAALISALEDGAARGMTMALFGADEGLPGLCDPGWRVLAAIPKTTTPIRIRSISSGSALSTALLYRDRPGAQLRFLGLLVNNDGASPLWSHLDLYSRSILRQLPPALCFARSEQLQACWPRLCKATKRTDGRLTILKNLSCRDESVDRFPFSDLNTIDPATFLKPDDKIVLQLDFGPPLIDRIRDFIKYRLLFRRK
jgi:16S rRNA C1402 (ribose-2'-O) methylase RsmI